MHAMWLVFNKCQLKWRVSFIHVSEQLLPIGPHPPGLGMIGSQSVQTVTYRAHVVCAPLTSSAFWGIPCTCSLVPHAPASLCSQPKLARCGPPTVPLNLLSPLPETLSPQIPVGLSSSLPSALKSKVTFSWMPSLTTCSEFQTPKPFLLPPLVFFHRTYHNTISSIFTYLYHSL